MSTHSNTHSPPVMNHPHLRIALFTAPLLLASCSVQSDEYDTPAPAVPANPIYDSPPAYEHDVPGNPAQIDPGLPADPAAQTFTTPAPHAIPSDAATTSVSSPAPRADAIVHTVVKGDTLSGISAQYKVPAASIRSANNMTNDTVVLGRRMIIPAR